MRTGLASKWGMTMLLALFALACATGRKDVADVEPGPVVVTVQNDNWNHIVVYAVAGGARVRLGDVAAGRSADLRMPPGVDPTTTDFRLLVDPIGSTAVYRTPRLPVTPGATIHLRVRNALGTSSYWIS